MATMILTVSTALLFFYLQIVCQKILRREFAREYYQVIAKTNCLEFPSVRNTVKGFGVSGEYSRLAMTLKCDFLALTYLLKYATNVRQSCSWEERLLMLYFRMLWASLVARHWLRWREETAVLRLTDILQYFANVVGERVECVRFEPWGIDGFTGLRN